MDDNEQLNDQAEVEEVPQGRIERVNIDQQMRSAYIDYSMSVIVSRALPDVRDGLKPVQRRVLYGMDKLSLNYSAATMKSAGIVGEVMGKYHPHGDSSIYDTMVRLAQDWSLRYPLVKGQGNFGSMDGYSAAAMRYTEAKLERVSAEVLADLYEDTVDMVKNFDERYDEPTVLPTKIPLLLVNGSSGIAVGMATNMAPHNLGECCDAICAYIDNPDIDVDGLMQYIKGPDFPTGGIIRGVQGIREAFETGHGRIVIRSKAEIEVAPNGIETIVVTEVPYMVNKKEMIKKIADLVKDGKIDGIAEINDFSNRKGVNIAIRLKKGANSGVVLNMLYKLSPLQSSFSVNNVAIVKGRPRTLNLRDLIESFVSHRHEIIVRRTKFRLAKAQARLHILEALLKAIDFIDEVIAIIRGSETVDLAKSRLMERFSFSEIQANAIVEMKLRALAGLEREKLQAEFDELSKAVADYLDILGSEERQMAIVKEETQEIKEKYADPRRSVIVPDEGEFNPEDFYASEDVVITISHLGYIKRTSLTEYRTQHRGGTGKKGSGTRDEDFLEHIFVAHMHSTLLLFTTLGKCYAVKVYQLPEGARSYKGRPIQNLLGIAEDEAVRAYLSVKDLKDREFAENNYVVLCSKKGIIKKTTLAAYANVRAKGIIALTIREGDELLSAELTNGNSQIYLAAREGRCVRFEESDVRPMGRTAAGVRGIRLASDDNEVVSIVCYDSTAEDATAHSALVVSENGYGKRSPFDEYRLTNRGGQGVKTLNVTEKTGKVVALVNVTADNDLMIITQSGLTIRLAVSTISEQGRATQGVRLINLREGDSIASVTVVPKEEEEEGVPEEGGPVEEQSLQNEAGGNE